MPSPEPDSIIHGEPWWRSKVEPERHQWSVRCSRRGNSDWYVNMLDLPPVIADPLAMAAALTAADEWIAAQTRSA